MKLSAMSVRRPVFTTVIFLAIIALGALAYLWIPIDLFPNIEIPAVSVFTFYPGANATDVEEKISKKLEDGLGGVAHLKEMTSMSRENISAVTLQFDYGTNMDEAANDVRQAIDFIRSQLPEDAEEPMLLKFDFSMFPILVFAAVSEKGDIRYYKDYIEDNVAEPLKRISGVGSVAVMGTPDYVVTLDVDNDALASKGMTLDDLLGALKAHNVTIPSGKIHEGLNDLPVRMPAEVETIQELEEIILVSRGITVRLGDVAKARLDLKDSYEMSELNGGTAVAAMVTKMSGANTVAVAEAVKERMAEIQKNLPEGVKLYTVMDSSQFIRHSVDNLADTLVWSILLVAAVVFLFLWRFVSSVVILVAMPASLILAFFAIYMAGYTLNVISLMSITIAVGMVVDNGIVVLENITRHIDRGKTSVQAAIDGTAEVGLAISASTLTTVIVFVPLVFVSGLVAILFGNLAYVLTVTILASLFVALTLTPMMCAKYLKKVSDSQKVTAWAERGLVRFEDAFGRFVGWCLHHRALVLLTATGIAATTILLVGSVGFDFMPPSNAGEIQVTLEMPVGTRVEETAAVGRSIVGELQQDPAVEYAFFRAGTDENGFGSMFGGKEGSHIIAMMVKLKPYEQRVGITDTMFAERIRAVAAQHHELKRSTVVAGSGMDAMLMGGGKPLTIEVRGDDLERMAEAAREVERILKTVPGTADVAADIPELRPELRFVPDRDKAATVQVLPAQLGSNLRTGLWGEASTKFRGMGLDTDIVVRLEKQDREDRKHLEDIQVRSLTGQLVRLKDVGSFEPGYSPVEIFRKDQQRVINVGAAIVDRALDDVARDAEKALRDAGMYGRSDVALVTAGMVKEQRTMFGNMGLMLLLGVLLVFLVMAAQFESWMDPFVVMFSIPFAFTGSFLLLWLTGTHLSIPAVLGLVILMGVVVNNAIVFVDYTNIMRREYGMGLNEALVTAASRRLRPVLMTSLTTIAGLVPMALAVGEGSEMWAPMGRSALGGMTFSTVIALVIVPVIYHLFERLRKKRVVEQAVPVAASPANNPAAD